MRAMKTSLIVTVFISATALAVSSFAQTSPAPGGKVSNSGTVPVPANPAGATAPTGQPSAANMQQMMEMSKLNENHKLLSSGDGTWDYIVKMWMDGDTSKKPQESKGTAVRKS